MFIGSGDFREIGFEFRGHFIRLGGLKPDQDVLDIGCGIGRMAVPLIGYLKGRYEGFDVSRTGIEWCQDHIASFHPNFHFAWIDVRNGMYQPNGSVPAKKFVFPYPNAFFDFAFATSVFTHLLPEDAQQYIRETRRTLRPGATFLATFFLTDGIPADRRKADHDFGVIREHHRTTSSRKPESAVAYSRAEIEQMLVPAGLKLETVHYGSWSGRDQWLSYQDIVLARVNDS